MQTIESKIRGKHKVIKINDEYILVLLKTSETNIEPKK